MPRTQVRRRRGGMRRRYGRRRGGGLSVRPTRPRNRAAANRVNDVAGVSETIPFEAQKFLPGTATTSFGTSIVGTAEYVWYNTDITLNDFPRAASVAQFYQYYKLKYLELTILPNADTFQAGGTVGIPYFYYMIDKGNTLPISLDKLGLQNMGAKPVKLDDKPIKIRWRPGVQLSTEISTSTGATSAQKYMISPWLNTDEDPNNGAFNPSQVVHNGIKFAAENAGGGTIFYRGSLTAHFEFKKPAVPAVPATQQAPQ